VDDEVVSAPLSDGGPGFVDVLHAALGGELVGVTVRGPLGAPTPGSILLSPGGSTAYVESAQACGLHLVPPAERDLWRGSTYGVGELVRAAVEAGAHSVVVGLGGSGTNDGGAGCLAALGAEPADPLINGPRGLGELAHVDLAPARERLAGIELVAATDVDHPLLGLGGATYVFGPQKGALPSDRPGLEAALATFAERADGRTLAASPGAGAAGGLGYALMLLGASRQAGVATVLELTGLARAFAAADLVITGEGAFDWQSLRGKVVHGVADACEPYGVPCIVLAGRVEVGRRDMNAHGIEAAYAMVDLRGGVEEAVRRPAAQLAALAERVARTWSPAR
jgi:glycerate kinase